jgi:hypothetical protein
VTGPVSFDPYDVEINADPYPTYERLRDEAPVYRNERYDFWALARHEDVQKALVNWQVFSSSRGDLLDVLRAGIEIPTGVVMWEELPIRSLRDRVAAFVGALVAERLRLHEDDHAVQGLLSGCNDLGRAFTPHVEDEMLRVHHGHTPVDDSTCCISSGEDPICGSRSLGGQAVVELSHRAKRDESVHHRLGNGSCGAVPAVCLKLLGHAFDQRAPRVVVAHGVGDPEGAAYGK